MRNIILGVGIERACKSVIAKSRIEPEKTDRSERISLLRRTSRRCESIAIILALLQWVLRVSKIYINVTSSLKTLRRDPTVIPFVISKIKGRHGIHLVLLAIAFSRSNRNFMSDDKSLVLSLSLSSSLCLGKNIASVLNNSHVNVTRCATVCASRL